MTVRVPEEQEPTTAGLDDRQARAESEAFADKRNLEREADVAQHDRRESIKNHIGFWVKVGVGIGSVIVMYGAGVWALHLLAPAQARFLSEAELAQLQQTMSHVVIGLIFGYLIKNRYIE